METAQNTSLRDHVFKFVEDRKAKQQLKEIAKESGVPEGWLKQFAQGKIDDPGSKKLEALYLYFTKQPLELKQAAI